MTFHQFATAYAEYFRSKGEGWLADYVTGLLEADKGTPEAIQTEMDVLASEMVVSKAAGHIADFGYAWTRQSRLWYLLLDWERFLATGEKYF